MQENNSQFAIKVIARLKTSLKIKTDIELSEFLNIRPNTISTWKKRNTLDYDAIISICELYDLDLNDIFLDKKSTAEFSTATPLVCKEAQFQYIKEDDYLATRELLPTYKFPFVTEGAMVFQAASNNMFPLIEENSYVICEPATVDSVKEDSLVVVISRNKGMLVNRLLKKDSSTMILSSDDVHFKDVKVDLTEIKELWSIVGLLSYDVNSHSKFRYFTETMKKISKFLDKQKA